MLTNCVHELLLLFIAGVTVTFDVYAGFIGAAGLPAGAAASSLAGGFSLPAAASSTGAVAQQSPRGPVQGKMAAGKTPASKKVMSLPFRKVPFTSVVKNTSNPLNREVSRSGILLMR